MRVTSLPVALLALLVVMVAVQATAVNAVTVRFKLGSQLCWDYSSYYLRLKDCGSTPNQDFELMANGMIKNVDGRCLGVAGDARDWASLRFAHCTGNGANKLAQQFVRTDAGDVVSVRDSRCVIRASGGFLKMFDCSRRSQAYSVVSAADGTDMGSWPAMEVWGAAGTGDNAASCLDGSSYFVRARDCDASSAAQQWSLSTNGYIYQAETGQCLDVQGKVQNWATVRVVNCLKKESQLWTVNSADGKLIAQQDARCARISSNSQVKMYDCGTSDDQTWSFSEQTFADDASSEASADSEASAESEQTTAEGEESEESTEDDETSAESESEASAESESEQTTAEGEESEETTEDEETSAESEGEESEETEGDETEETEEQEEETEEEEEETEETEEETEEEETEEETEEEESEESEEDSEPEEETDDVTKVYTYAECKEAAPSCEEKWLGDGNCGRSCNRKECNYDGWDCKDKPSELMTEEETEEDSEEEETEEDSEEEETEEDSEEEGSEEDSEEEEEEEEEDSEEEEEESEDDDSEPQETEETEEEESEEEEASEEEETEEVPSDAPSSRPSYPAVTKDQAIEPFLAFGGEQGDGQTPEQWDKLNELTFDHNGLLWVGDGHNERLQIFSMTRDDDLPSADDDDLPGDDGAYRYRGYFVGFVGGGVDGNPDDHEFKIDPAAVPVEAIKTLNGADVMLVVDHSSSRIMRFDYSDFTDAFAGASSGNYKDKQVFAALEPITEDDVRDESSGKLPSVIFEDLSGLAIDSDDNLYLSNKATNWVFKLEPTGSNPKTTGYRYAGAFSDDAGFDKAETLMVYEHLLDEDGERQDAVVLATSEKTSDIKVFNTDGDFLGVTIGRQGKAPGRFAEDVEGSEVDNHNAWLLSVDEGASRVLLFDLSADVTVDGDEAEGDLFDLDADNAFLGAFGKKDGTQWEMSSADGVTASKDGKYVAVCDQKNFRVLVWKSEDIVEAMPRTGVPRLNRAYKQTLRRRRRAVQALEAAGGRMRTGDHADLPATPTAAVAEVAAEAASRVLRASLQSRKALWRLAKQVMLAHRARVTDAVRAEVRSRRAAVADPAEASAAVAAAEAVRTARAALKHSRAALRTAGERVRGHPLYGQEQ